MRKYKTKHEQFELDWSKFEKRMGANKWPYNITQVGTEKKDILCHLESIYDFVPTGFCNLFNKYDMCKIMIDLELDFNLIYWSTKGRDRFCQIEIKYGKSEHYISVKGSGYGTGEAIWFSKKFPNKLKYLICREMAISQIDFNKEYYEGLTDQPKARDEGILKTETLSDLLINHARSYEDLISIAEIYHMLSSYNLYHKGTLPKELKQSKIDFDKRWGKFIKKPMYQLYLKQRRKIIRKNGKK